VSADRNCPAIPTPGSERGQAPESHGNRFVITAGEGFDDYVTSSGRSRGDVAIRVAIAVGTFVVLALAAVVLWSVRGAL
jgi:hypothetical protein